MNDDARREKNDKGRNGRILDILVMMHVLFLVYFQVMLHVD